jgi:hypothetical protein
MEAKMSNTKDSTYSSVPVPSKDEIVAIIGGVYSSDDAFYLELDVPVAMKQPFYLKRYEHSTDPDFNEVFGQARGAVQALLGESDTIGVMHLRVGYNYMSPRISEHLQYRTDYYLRILLEKLEEGYGLPLKVYMIEKKQRDYAKEAILRTVPNVIIVADDDELHQRLSEAARRQS